MTKSTTETATVVLGKSSAFGDVVKRENGVTTVRFGSRVNDEVSGVELARA